jgi:uncharacterized phage protein (TIGR02218 family)
MRHISPSALERLKGSTTLCHCWKLTLKDGTQLGFTDHDRDLYLGSLACRSATGLSGSDVEHSLGFAVGGSEISGVLTSDAITSADIDSGRYDGAMIECWWVDWSSPNLRALLDAGRVGEIRRSEHGFTAEIRSLAQLFEAPHGRFFSRLCSAQFGDRNCKAHPLTFAARILQSISDYECYLTRVDLPADSLTGGYLIPPGGERLSIRQHLQLADKIYLRLWVKPRLTLMEGAGVQLESACNKSRELCDALYRNIENFRGFPLMPSAELVLLPPDPATQQLDGGSVFQ